MYLDDIIVYTKELDEHRRIVREVLRRLEENDLFLKLEKCEFERGEVEYLGLLIKQGEIHMDPVKTKAITDWPTPRSKKRSNNSEDLPISIADLSKTLAESLALLTG